MEFYVHDGSQQLGPFTAAAIHQMARLETIPATASVWHQGAADWYPLSEFLKQNPSPPEAEPEIRLSAGELRARVIAKERAQLAGLAAEGQRNLLWALGAGFAVAFLGGLLWWLQGRFTRGMLIPGPGVLIGMAVGSTITKLGKGEGSGLLPTAAVLFTLLAHLAAGISFNMLTLFFLGMALFMAWKLSYL